MAKDDNVFLNVKWFIATNLAIAFVVCSFICFTCFFSLEGWAQIWGNLLFSFLISSLMSGGISIIIGITSKRVPWLESPVKRFAIELISVTLYAFLMSFILLFIFILFIWKYTTLEEITFFDVAENTILPTVIALIITVFLTSRSFLFEWRRTAIEAEKLKNETLKSQYQSLKDQLNPHFLFNSLNVLSNLVHENQEQAGIFIDKLAKIYRYVLEVQNEELVELDRELVFVKSYMVLQELRFGNKFSYDIQSEMLMEGFLPPLSLQLLLENALKHNIATREKPLHIGIRREGDFLVVENQFQPRTEPEQPSGIGLRNIRERYQYFTKVPVEVQEGAKLFIVRLPLIAKIERV